MERGNKTCIAALASGILLCAQGFAQVTLRVSVSSNEVQQNLDSISNTISGDGRFVAFESAASNLVPGDTNGAKDIFVRDRLLGTTERVSVSSSGAQSNGNDFWSPYLSLSADGRFVVFETNATNLVPGDTNNAADLFVRDRQLGTTERVSVDSTGAQANDRSLESSTSADGRYVAFRSYASNLVVSDTGGWTDIFVRDRIAGTTERVSIRTNGTAANSNSQYPAISADGRFVVFASYATNLVSGDTNGLPDVFLRDRVAGTTVRISLALGGGGQADGSCLPSSISADGRLVAFESDASNLVAGDTNGTWDAFVCDWQNVTTERISVSMIGGPGGILPLQFPAPVISADGRYVAFVSDHGNLVSGDTNGFMDVFLRDRQLGTTERVSVATKSVQGTGESLYPGISADGRFVSFSSVANNFAYEDTNGRFDIFIRDGAPAGFTSMCDPGVDGVLACPCSNPPSGLGRGCDNSSSTGGATLAASGLAYLSMDDLRFSTNDERPTALSILTQWNADSASGTVFGMGVRCTSGSFKRLFSQVAVAGSIHVPDFAAGDPTVSARSAALGNVINAGESRWYFVFYRDPNVLGGCSANSTFNATQTGQVAWQP